VLIGERQEDPHGFRETYVNGPFVDGKFGLVLMNDRGCQLKDVADFGTTIFSQFSKIMSTAMFLCECLPHGDVLPHNIVFDERKEELTLVDIDEGVSKPQDGVDCILQRKTNTVRMQTIGTFHCHIQTHCEERRFSTRNRS
jgi:hypothetical protein